MAGRAGPGCLRSERGRGGAVPGGQGRRGLCGEVLDPVDAQAPGLRAGSDARAGRDAGSGYPGCGGPGRLPRLPGPRARPGGQDHHRPPGCPPGVPRPLGTARLPGSSAGDPPAGPPHRAPQVRPPGRPPPGQLPRRVRASARSGHGGDAVQHQRNRRSCLPAGRRAPGRSAPATSQRGHGDAAQRRVAGRDRPGAAAVTRGHDGRLCQGRPGGAAGAGSAVAGRQAMTGLRQAAADYLAVRRALGFKLNGHPRLLSGLVSYLETAGATTVTTELATAWALLPAGHARTAYLGKRLSVARGFARHLQAFDPAAEVPPAGLLHQGPRRPAPYLYSGGDITAVMAAARQLRPALRAATYQTLVGLLAVTGMRIGEAIRMDRDHIDRHEGVVTVWYSKFGKSRELPLHPTTMDALGA